MSIKYMPKEHVVFIDDFKVGDIVIEVDEYVVFYSNDGYAYTVEHLQDIAEKMKAIENQALGKETRK